MAADTPPADRLETVTCGRCLGSGRYSYNAMHGSVCYGCGGAKVVHTKRGAAAAAWLEDLCSVPARDIVAGDLVRHTVVGIGGVGKAWARVRMVVEDRMRTTSNGVTADVPVVTLHCAGGSNGKGEELIMTVSPDTAIRKGFDAATKKEQLAKAIAFQATLDARGRTRRMAA